MDDKQIMLKRFKQLFIFKKFPVFLQEDKYDCGPSCLKMITKFYGKNFSIEHLRYVSKLSPDGITGKNLIDALDELGFKTMPALIDFKTLSIEAPLPCVVSWRDRHFLIVYKIRKNKVYVADPSFGLLTYTKNEFIDAWANKEKKGLTFLLEPSARFYEQEENTTESGLKIIIPFLRNYKKYILQIVIGLFVGVIIQLMLPFVTQALVDKGINYQDLNFVYILLIAQLTLFLSSSFINVFRSWLLLFVSTRVSMLITSEYLTKLLKKSLSFFDSKTPGDILQRVNESRRIETFLNNAPGNIFSYFNALFFLIFLLYYSIAIFSIFTIGIIIYTTWVWFFMKKREKLDFKRFEASSMINSTLIQTVNGISEIKANGSEKKHVWEWEKGRVRYYKNTISTLKLNQLQSIGGSIINELKNILITFTAAILVINGKITLGTMLAIQYIIGQINTPLLSLIGFFSLVQDAKLSITRFKQIDFETPEERIINDQNLHSLPEKSNDIFIENLSFSYGGKNGVKILKNINLHIPKGKVTAIVGNSGGGKSTLMKILLKLYLPTEGEVKIGNINLNHIDSHKWLELCGTVLQEGYIFSDTISNNIIESSPYEALDRERLLKAVKIANIEGLINDLPSGFNSMISPAGSSGRTLSGGQRQRLLIARAVYKNPQFLFFDEATSALDANNEKAIVENLKKFIENKTVLIIAHRLSTVKNADHIIVLDEGEIKEVGNHSSLIEQKGYYYKLVKNQLELGN
jgi:ATP-binding cassette subfamily B protein